ncbi:MULTISPECIES: hypothetical protein [Halomonas]|uniref:hypothetical protein n=1 Tax=Halomonas TaxID=2745 RepID=UPI001CD6F036|nr:MULTISPECIES: hypothetical protein [Halomonas]MCA0915731.1 hypothetical protein [Halomonas denitrificans]
MPRRLTQSRFLPNVFARPSSTRHPFSTLQWLTWLVALWLSGCAGAPERPDSLRQALLGLGHHAAEQVAQAPPLAETPLIDQVLLLSPPNVDERLSLSVARVQESLTRGLLAIDDGPQVLDWQPGDTPAADTQQWLIDSRLIADGPRLRLSDRELVPYRFELRLRRPGDGAALWSTVLNGAFDADAL